MKIISIPVQRYLIFTAHWSIYWDDALLIPQLSNKVISCIFFSLPFFKCSYVHFNFSGKNESLRARAILRSLVPLDDLQGVLSLRFTLLNPAAGQERPKSDTPSGLIPGHKQSIVLFLERVYGIETQELFFKLLEEAFLPDLRAATMLDRVSISTVDTHAYLERIKK